LTVSYEIHYPHSDSTSIYVEVSRQEGVHYSADYRFFDANTLNEIETPSVSAASTRMRILPIRSFA